MIFYSNRKLSAAIECNRRRAMAIGNRRQLRAFDCIRAMAIGGNRLLSMAIVAAAWGHSALPALADEPLLGGFVSAVSADSAAVRLENRAEGTLGKAVVFGTEWKSANGETRAVAWDTTAEEDGWKDLGGAAALVRNDPSIAVEGGRLQSNTTWTSNATHLVRNTVIVPTNVTLTVVTNAVVKFCESTGIKVEAGGRLRLLGSLEENVVFTLANDDTVGGDTDMAENREWATSNATYAVTAVSGGTISDMNAAFRGTTVESFGTASVNATTVVDGSEGVIRIPVFVSGSRTTQFSVDWKTSEGHSGRLVWAKASDGTKYVELPVADCAESFTLTLVESRGINISATAHETAVTVYRSELEFGVSAVSEASEAVHLENRAEGTLGRALVRGTEYIAADGETRAVAWDSTQVADGWQANGTLVRNDASIAIEGGRLQSNTTWSPNVTHLVRNWVVVPTNVTLRIEAGTVVKFCELTGFKVEAGGRLVVAGMEESPVVYTAAADDTIGGDSDLREATPNDGDYAVDIVPGGTYTDSNCAVRYTTFSNLGTATVPAKATAALTDGIVRIPITISTDRTTKFCVDWRVAASAVPITVVTNLSGRITWNSKNDGTRYIELPLVPGTVADGFGAFTVELYESQGINISTTARRCEVAIYSNDRFPMAVSASSEESAAVRLENRDFEWSYGAPLVFGTEWKSADGETRAVVWDTTTEADGWKDLGGASLLVRNDPSIAIEGGRLQANAIWSNNVTHLVRNWVVVPTNVTLTIAAGAVVKFCDETGIKVEAGGRLVSAGTAASDVIFTSVNDDTVGGDTDMVSEEPLPGDYAITVVSGGTFTDAFTQMRYGTSGTFGSAFLPAKVVAKKDGGIVRIPITINTSRTTPFAVDWIAYGESLGRVLLDAPTDYDDEGIISGRIEWTGSSQGTKYLEIPLDRMAATGEDESFVIELVTGLGINLNLSSSVCEVELYDTRDAFVGSSNGHAESEWCEFAAMDSSAGVHPKFTLGEVPIRYSTRWADNGAAMTLTSRTGGSPVQEGAQSTTLYESSSAAEGSTTWNGADYEDGRYDLTHKILDADGHAVKIDSATFIVNRDVVQHAGRLSTNETWSADKVHLVVATVTVPSGVTLTIVPDAIVKFMPGASIVVEQGGLGICRGAVLTHAYDDVMGGDTFFDGAETVPENGGYSLSGDWEADETTQYRYSMPQGVGGTLRGENHWPGHKTYIVTNNLTLASGATLTIDAGAVVKFNSLKMLTVNSGATLIVNGTRSSPVVFTSIKDDDFGGDTNGDGDNSVAQPGDWEEIRNSGGTIKFEYVKCRYAGYGQYTNQGDAILRATGGTTTLYGCTLEQSQFRIIYRSGGTVAAQNCVFEDARTGIDGGASLTNCVVARCNTAVSSATLYNTILWSCDSYGSGTFRNCIAYGTATSVPNGVIFADPKFEDAEKGDYRIRADSPCVDAGDGSVAPVKDYYNQPRQTIQTVTPTGTPDATGAYADIGIYEVQPRYAGADVDLEVKSVMVPETLTVGELVTISWREANIGSVNTDGKWYDKVELVSANGTVVTLGTVPVAGIVAGGEKTITEASFRVPAVAEGTCAIRVTANYQRDIYEGSLTANNVCLSDDVTVSVAGVDFSEGSVAKIKLLQGQQVSYKLTGLPTGGGSLVIHSASGELFGAYVAFGKMPTTYANDSSYVVLPSGDVLVSIPPHTGDDAAYLMLDSKEKVQNGSLDVTVSDDYPAIYALSKESMPNTGSQSLTIYGVGLDSIGRVALVATDGSEIVGTSVRSPNACELSASFTLTGAKTGAYRAAVTKDGTQAVSSSFVSVIPHANAKAHLEISLDAPSAIRQNRWYEAVVTVKNTGDADAMLPVVVVSGDNIEFKDPDGGDEIFYGVIQLFPANEKYNSLVIEAGGNATVKVTFRSSSSDARIKCGFLELINAGWTSFIAKGSLTQSEWEVCLHDYSDGFSDVSDFVSKVFAKLSQISLSGHTPFNAFRIYDIVQKEKGGSATGIVFGNVFGQDGNAVSGLHLGVASFNDPLPVYVTTDASGAFLAYGVSTGMVAFVCDTGTLTPVENVDLTTEKAETCVLKYVEKIDSYEDTLPKTRTRQFNPKIVS